MDQIDEWLKRAFNQEDQPKKPSLNEPGQGQLSPKPAVSRPQGQNQTPRPQPQRPGQSSGGFRPAQAQRSPAQARPVSPNVHARPKNPPRPAGTPAPQRAAAPQAARPQHSANGPRPNSRGPRSPQAARTQGAKAPYTKKPVDPNKPGLAKGIGGRLTMTRPKATPKAPQLTNKGKLRIIPIGGLNEVGKNMTAIEYEDDIVIIDVGLEFPSEEMLGIDYVIPDVTYLEDNKKRIRGILITHGHLDHIGGLPYVLPRLDFPPVYGTKLTMGLVKKRVDEFKQEKLAKLNVIDPDKPLKLGQFLCEFFRVVHSIPDCVGITLTTPVGKVVHTGDFKFDDTPARNINKADIHKMEALGKQNVLALLCESTNSLKPGHSMSEQEVGEVLDGLVKDTKGRLVVASFSSQIGRLQQIFDAAVRHNRKVFISGRSMRENIEISAKLGYLEFPKGLLQDVKRYKDGDNDRETLILTTGSQGESISALTRMASNEHPHVKVRKGDTIILSSSPIVGNERAIATTINQLTMQGAKVIHNQMMDVHTSGHGKQDELAKMINYVKPKYLIPIHGEYYMRTGLADMAMDKCGIPEDKIIIVQNGEVITAHDGTVQKTAETVDSKYILIDGLGEGHGGSQVQVDREILSQNGALIVLLYIAKQSRRLTRDPDVVSRGFIYMHESDEITRELGQMAMDAYRKIMEKNPGAERKDIKRYVQQSLDKYTHSKLERRPLIIPLLVEV